MATNIENAITREVTGAESVILAELQAANLSPVVCFFSNVFY